MDPAKSDQRDAPQNLAATQHRRMQQNGRRKNAPTSLERFRHNRELPLNLILLITAWLDDAGDISRVTRTSRLLYYMTLPRLWEHVTLRSYSAIRYKDGRPEGFGSGSPFSMALEALVSRQVSQYVKSLRMVGEWREIDVEDFAKGRVPDNTAMLNIVVRAALDKCVNLTSFSWELNVKPLKTIYVGLAALKNLQSLTLKLPATRIPRPTTLIPAISNLRYLHLFDIDPLCYPDDLSFLIASCTKLETLKMAWSPRMRREKEPSVTMDSYFGRAAAANVRFFVKHLAFKNLYARSSSDYTDIFALDNVESLTLLNCVNLEDPGSVFMDDTWRLNPPDWSRILKLKRIRFDTVDEALVQFLMRPEGGLEEVYIANSRHAGSQTSSPGTQTGSSPSTPAPDTPTQAITPSHSASASLGASYIASLTSHHGHTLRILLLSDQWNLSDSILDLLIRSCPNLEQFGAAIEGSHFQACRTAAKHLPKLRAFRALAPVEDKLRLAASNPEDAQQMERFGQEMIAREVWKPEYGNIRYFGLGARAFEFGNVIGVASANGERIFRRDVKVMTCDEAKRKCELFGMDSLDI